jgi:hypothetical protein
VLASSTAIKNSRASESRVFYHFQVNGKKVL